jgi:hypothetical protein
MTRTWWRSSLNPRTRPCWAPIDTRPIRPKSGDAAPWTEKVFVVNQRLRLPRRRYGMSPDSYESRFYKLSVKFKNSPIGVRMKSWQPLQLGSILQSESNIQNVLDLDSSFPCTKSDVLAGGEHWEDLGLVPNQFLWSSMFSM